MTAITGKPAKIYTAYFSPTGGTKKAALALTRVLWLIQTDLQK